MPGLLPNSLSGPAATASDRRAFPKPFSDVEASANQYPFGVKAVRISHIPLPHAMRVQWRLNPVAEIAKVGVLPVDRSTSTGWMMSECTNSECDRDPSSVCLVAMVNEFIESASACSERADSGSLLEDAMSNGLTDICKSVQSLACCRDDLEMNLLRDVQAIVRRADEYPQYGCAHADRKHLVMDALQRIGYDAGICKTRWERSSGLPGGDYEYIDVLFASDTSTEPLRLLVDIEFQAQFVIARPSREFSQVLQLVPPIFVGRPERLQQMVHLMAEAAKQSLCVKGLHVPPWRKLNYMKAKWFSVYERASNYATSSSHERGEDSMNDAGIAMRGYGLDMRRSDESELLNRDRGATKGAIFQSNARDESITVTMTNWQPPPLEVRPCSNTRSQSNLTGLASMFLHGGPPTCNGVVARVA